MTGVQTCALPICYLPSLLLAIDPTYAAIKAVRTAMIWPSHEICIYYRKGSIQLPVIETFLRAVRAAALQISPAPALGDRKL